MMELIPIIDDVSDVLFANSPAEAGKQDATHQPPALELLEDRVLLASDASVPIATPVADGMPAEPTAYVASQHPGHELVDIAGVAAAVDAPPDPGTTTHDNSSSGQVPTHPSESHAEVVENHSEQPETRLPETGELVEHDANRNEFGLATIEPEPSRLPRAREAAAELIGDNQKISPTSDPGKTDQVTGEMDADGPAVPVVVEVAVKTVADELSTGIVQGTPVPAAVVLETNGDLSSEQPVKNNAPPKTQADALIHNVLQAESANAAGMTKEASRIAEETGETDGADVNPYAPDVADAINSPVAAHDALFANGGGVETVLERPSA